MIKPQGVLANLDWKKEPKPFGPPLEIRFSPETASRLITGAGFIIESIKDSGPILPGAGQVEAKGLILQAGRFFVL